MRSLSQSVAVLFALVFIGTSSAQELQWRFPSDVITPQQWEEFRAEVLAKPGVERQEFADQLVLTSAEELKVYVFTLPAHPAHPAVVIRAVVASGGSTSVRRMGHYAGNQEAFDKWWHEFDALDERIPGQVR